MKNVVKAAVAITIAAVSVASTASAHHNSTPKYAGGFVTQAYKDSHPWEYPASSSTTSAYGNASTSASKPATVTIINRGAYAITVRPTDTYGSTYGNAGLATGRAATYEEGVHVQVHCAGYGESEYRLPATRGDNLRITYWGSCFGATTGGHDIHKEAPTDSSGQPAPRGVWYYVN